MNIRIKMAAVFFLGILFGFGIAIGIGLYKNKKDAGQPLMGPKVFGNIRIYQEPLARKDNSGSEQCRALVLERDGRILLRINQSKPGVAGDLWISNNPLLPVAVPIVYIRFAENNEGPVLRYGRLSSKHHGHLSQKFIDLDMDGQFDYMINRNDKGQVNYENAYFKKTQEWVDVSESDIDKDRHIIKVNNKTYEFIQDEWKEVVAEQKTTEPNNVDTNGNSQ